MKSDVTRTVDVFLEGSQKPLLVVLGPTASGKTGFSIELAKNIHGEIVNADSRQLYRKLNIGTAKIMQGEMEGVPHHLIDILDPKEELTVSWYRERAEKIIDEIRGRGNIPILVGGSMLYLASVTDDLSLGPAKDPEIRQRLEDLYDRDGSEVLYKKLQKMDPESAADIHPNNRHRIIRALEICEILKEKKSKAISSRAELRPRQGGTERFVTPRGVTSEPACRQAGSPSLSEGGTKGVGGATPAPPSCAGYSRLVEGAGRQHDTLIFGIERSPAELKERIALRTEEMFAKGWITEVRGLLAQGYEADDPGMKSCGYGEIIEYLCELETGGSDPDIDRMQQALQQKIVSRTRQYAKRQMTWWRGDERIRWVAP